jgi:hypothetical protein
MNSRLCAHCEERWPKGWAQCPDCRVNTVMDPRQPTRSAEWANFYEWCAKNGRTEEPA